MAWPYDSRAWQSSSCSAPWPPEARFGGLAVPAKRLDEIRERLDLGGHSLLHRGPLLGGSGALMVQLLPESRPLGLQRILSAMGLLQKPIQPLNALFKAGIENTKLQQLLSQDGAITLGIIPEIVRGIILGIILGIAPGRNLLLGHANPSPSVIAGTTRPALPPREHFGAVPGEAHDVGHLVVAHPACVLALCAHGPSRKRSRE